MIKKIKQEILVKKFRLGRKNTIKLIVVLISFFLGVFYSSKKEINRSLIKPTASFVTITADDLPVASPSAAFYQVVRVIDGDTIVVKINDKNETVRLIGINSPEVNDPRKPVECFGHEASNKAKEILTGKKVRLEADPTQSDRDKYGRLLRYVFLKDGTNFNQLMIEQGYAFEYTYHFPYRYQKEFKQAQKKAEKEGMGLWEEGRCGK